MNESDNQIVLFHDPSDQNQLISILVVQESFEWFTTSVNSLLKDYWRE